MAARPLAAFVTATTRADAPLFNDTRACAMLVAGLQFYRQALEFQCYAFVLLPAELQLLIAPKPRGGGVSEILKNVKGLFAGKYNKLRGTQGPVWCRSFNAEPVLSATALRLRVSDIERAPVRAGLAKNPEQYEWSSARWMSGEVPNLIVDAMPKGS